MKKNRTHVLWGASLHEKKGHMEHVHEDMTMDHDSNHASFALGSGPPNPSPTPSLHRSTRPLGPHQALASAPQCPRYAPRARARAVDRPWAEHAGVEDSEIRVVTALTWEVGCSILFKSYSANF